MSGSAPERINRVEQKLDIAIESLSKIAVLLEKVENQESKINSIEVEQKDQSKRLYEVEKYQAVADELHNEIKEDNKETRETIKKSAWWVIGMFGTLLLGVIMLALKMSIDK